MQQWHSKIFGWARGCCQQRAGRLSLTQSMPWSAYLSLWHGIDNQLRARAYHALTVQWCISYTFCHKLYSQHIRFCSFSPNWPTGPIRSSSHDIRLYPSMYVCILSPLHAIFFKASHWPSGHMIRSRPLIGLSELCILDQNSEDLQS